MRTNRLSKCEFKLFILYLVVFSGVFEGRGGERREGLMGGSLTTLWPFFEFSIVGPKVTMSLYVLGLYVRGFSKSSLPLGSSFRYATGCVSHNYATVV